MSKFNRNTNINITCPYCGWEDSSSWECGLQDTETEERVCDSCDKRFTTTARIVREFTSKPDCELNGAEHNWRSWYQGELECTVCGKWSTKAAEMADSYKMGV